MQNAETFFAKTIDSVLSQSFEDFEWLIIDDGSEDDSVEIIEQFDDDRIRYFQSPSVGIGAARNHGVEQSRGEYLVFLDSDDLLRSDAFFQINTAFMAKQVDILIYSYAGINQYGRIFKRNKGISTRLSWSESDGVTALESLMADQMIPAVWNKVFKRKFLIRSGVRFDDSAYHQDLGMTALALAKASRVALLRKDLVYYRSSPNSVSKRCDDKHVDSLFNIFKTLHDRLLSEKAVSLELFHTFYISHVFYNYHLRGGRFSDKQQINYLKNLLTSLEGVEWNKSGLSNNQNVSRKLFYNISHNHSFLGHAELKENLTRALFDEKIRHPTTDIFRTGQMFLHNIIPILVGLRESVRALIPHYFRLHVSIRYKWNKFRCAPSIFFRDSKFLINQLVFKACGRVLASQQFESLLENPVHYLITTRPGKIAEFAERRSTSKAKSDATYLEEKGSPMVSVIIPVFNGVDHIQSSVNSILTQFYHKIEIIIVNDASDDLTLDVLEDMSAEDSRIRIISLSENLGAARARNEGLKIAKGDYVTFQDADDYSESNRISAQLCALLRQPHKQLSICNYKRIDFDGRVISLNGKSLHKCLVSMMFSRELVLAELGYLLNLPVSEDAEYFRRLKAHFGEDSVVYVFRTLYLALFRQDSSLFSHVAFNTRDQQQLEFEPNRKLLEIGKYLDSRISAIEAGTMSPFVSYETASLEVLPKL